MARIIKHQFSFAHPQETVWAYLTKPELMELWLMKTNFQPVVGAEFQFTTGPSVNLNFDGIFYCKVLEINPFTSLSYSWNGGPGEGKITLDSVVIWRLEATEKGTDVFLEHRGFEKEENLDMYNALNKGWEGKFPKIDKLLHDAAHGHTDA